MALPGELNGYPGPKHVLELATELGLSPLQHEAIVLGELIVAAERSLDASFADGSIDAASLSRAVEEIRLLQGQLRAVHLVAHLETKVLLTGEQNHQYTKLRGYNPANHSEMEHHGHKG